MENAYYLLFHMDIHDRCTFQYSNQINARWCGDYGIDVSHETRKGIWGCRNLKTLELDMRCFGADKLEKSVQLRVLNGYIARRSILERVTNDFGEWHLLACKARILSATTLQTGYYQVRYLGFELDACFRIR
ncbi:hypothetical protein FBU30_009321 [Linnemannia zychae]|nr:hypothetical protein FBU30_009321 [Linnemannia zychae]